MPPKIRHRGGRGQKYEPTTTKSSQAELLDSRGLLPAIGAASVGAAEMDRTAPSETPRIRAVWRLRLASLMQDLDRHDLLPCELCQGGASERARMSRTSLKAPGLPVDGCPVRRSY